MSLMKSACIGVAAAIGLAASPAAALVTFGSSNVITTSNIRYVTSTTGSSQIYTTPNNTATSPGLALATFSVSDAVSGFLPLAATLSNFSLSASVPTVTGLSSGSPFSISGVSGTFSFMAQSPVTAGLVTGVNLLSAIFTNATLSGTIGGSSITLSGNSTSGTLTYTSDFLDFTDINTTAFSLTGNTAAAIGLASSGRINNFRASVNGNFASNPPPVIPRVPEPETWAMLVLGFGLVGVAARRRKSVILA